MEETLLGDCLRSIRSNLPHCEIAVIDGAYKSWVDQVKLGSALEFQRGHRDVANALLRFVSPVSTDNTLEICKQYGVEHVILPKKGPDGEYIPWETEAIKRNEFFKIGQTDDWILWLDGDERIEGTIKLEELTGDVYNIMLRRDDTIPPYKVMRLYRQQPTIKIEGAHHAVWIDGKIIKRDDQRLLGGCGIFHLYNQRGDLDRVRVFAKGYYYRWLLGPNGEQPFRTEHGI